MSVPTIALYFPFRRINIINQCVTAEAGKAHIQMQPDKRFTLICQGCGYTEAAVHSWSQRRVRDLSMATAQIWLDCRKNWPPAAFKLRSPRIAGEAPLSLTNRQRSHSIALQCRSGGIGRRRGLKILRAYACASSTLASGTTYLSDKFQTHPINQHP